MSERIQTIVIEVFIDTNRGVQARQLSWGQLTAERETLEEFKARVVRALDQLTGKKAP